MTDTGIFLGIETSGTTTGVALVRGEAVLFEEVQDASTGHDRVLLREIERALVAAGTSASQLVGIGVTSGPGMFTSLRVGLATAKGLAVAHRRPIVGVSTLWALAASAGLNELALLAVTDARKSQVYAALYRDGRELLAPYVAAVPELAVTIAGIGLPGIAAAGDGVALCAEALRRAGVTVEDTELRAPTARVIALEAQRRLREGHGDDVALIEPLYLRRTDAELNREKNR